MSNGHPPRGATSLAGAVQTVYAEGQTDYSIEPLLLSDSQGKPVGRIKDGDAVIFCCRRGEREIQLTEAFTEADFNHFQRPELKNLKFVILTLYHEKFKNLPVAFAPTRIKDTLGEIVSLAGYSQLHTSESEKFAHVTFFLNGGNSQPFEGEDDVRIPSPRGISFDRVPELSLPKVVDQVFRGVDRRIDLIVANFANGDVIGHTSNNEAKIRCAAVVDHWLGEVVQKAVTEDYVVLVTADHGNLEEMITADGSPHVSHTANPVPFLVIDSRGSLTMKVRCGSLADVAPTALSILGLEQPAIMEGTSLVSRHDWGGRRRLLIVILDGWGIGREDDSNPIHLAEIPVWDGLMHQYPSSQLQAAGEAVGLKSGKAGNSEAGHMNIGAGRIILQDDVRLDQAMRDGSFYRNEIFLSTIHDVRQSRASLHLIGLLTEKSSHGSIDYPLALLRMAKDNGLDRVYLHIIFDGRSTQPGSAPAMLEKLESQVDAIGVGQIVSGVGRGIALDRDGDYAKTKRAYDAFVFGVGLKCTAS